MFSLLKPASMFHGKLPSNQVKYWNLNIYHSGLKMNGSEEIRISEDILKMADKCRKNHSCLSGQLDDLCKVELNVDDKIHFVKCMTQEFCPYRISFGYSYVCLCPVRKELFDRYNI